MGNATMLLSALVIGSATVHTVLLVILAVNELFLPSCPLISIGWYVDAIPFPTNPPYPLDGISNRADALTFIFVRVFAYSIFASVISFAMGCGLAQAVARKLGTFCHLGPLYYGGLYEIISGNRDPDIYVSILMHKEIDGKSIIYNGFLEDIYLKSDGNVDYIVLHTPMKAFARFVRTKQNFTSSTFRSMGVNLNNKKDNPLVGRRLMIEGQDIANIYFEKIEDSLEKVG